MSVTTITTASQLAALQDSQQQLSAARRLQAQAEQRVQLGRQLFKAAEAHLANQQSILAQVRAEQDALVQAVQEDVARSLRQYDDYLDQQRHDVEGRLDRMEQQLASLTEKCENVERHVDALVRRAEALLDQSRCLLDQPLRTSASPAHVPPSVPPADDPPPPEQMFARLVKKMPRN